jgi:S-adenosylmethionine-dependent methyltransferase
VTPEHCAECGFEGESWSDEAALDAISDLGAPWAEAVAGLEPLRQPKYLTAGRAAPVPEAPVPDSIVNADFSSSIPAWRMRLGLVRDVVRQELVHRQLIAHLPPPDPPGVRVLDVGCGQGTQTLLLARAGYAVTGLDPSEELLGLVEKAAAAEPNEVRRRIELHQGPIEDCGKVGAEFDVVCCHGVVMYLPSLTDAITQLVSAARPGGLISVLTKNRANLALRAAMAGEWENALAAFDARRYINRLGVRDTRADDPEEVMAALAGADAETQAWYGVRLFTDHWGDVDPPSDMEVILRAEDEAGKRDPYRRLASATHVIAIRDEPRSQ